MGSEAGTGFEVERAVAAFIVSGNLIRDCDYFFRHGLLLSGLGFNRVEICSIFLVMRTFIIFI